MEGKVIGRDIGQLLKKLEVISGSMRLGYFTAGEGLGEKDDCLYGQCGKQETRGLAWKIKSYAR